MPIPTGGVWPPPQLAPAYNAYRDWDAWYSGSPDRLRKVYINRGADGQSLPPSQRVRAGQYSGGLVGAVSRFLWGAPPPSGQRDDRLHVQLPSDVARTAAGLLFSEPITLNTEDEALKKRCDQLQEDGLTRMLFSAASANSALGDVYLRPIIDEEVMPGRAFLAPVHADGAIPVIRWGRLIEVTFWECVHIDGSQHYRLLEHHDVVNKQGRITYALYEGTHDKLGDKVPFSRLPQTALYAKEPFSNGVQATGLDRLDVVRIPNSEPQRLWRTDPALKYFGASDFDGNEQWFDAADRAWTSWMGDLFIAKGRILVPDYMLQSQGVGNGATFNAEQQIFRGLSALANQSTANPIQAVQFEIRWQEHKATLDALTDTALRHAGLSTATFSNEGDITKTATEVNAEVTQSSITRGARIQVYGPAIADAIELLTMVEAKQLNGSVVGRPAVEFADGVTESPKVIAETVQLIAAAEAASKRTLVKMLHPDWTEPEVDKELAEMRKEREEIALQMQVENPGDELGPPNGPPKGAADEE